MKSFISIAILLFTIQLSHADDVVPKKTCKDFFPDSVSLPGVTQKKVSAFESFLSLIGK